MGIIPIDDPRVRRDLTREYKSVLYFLPRSSDLLTPNFIYSASAYWVNPPRGPEEFSVEEESAPDAAST